MNRLTKKNECGVVYFPKCFEEPCYGKGCTERCDECEYDTAMGEKLAAYEDTGLEPEEIIANQEMFKAYRHVCRDRPPEEVEKALELLDLLPCRDNETIYCIDDGEVCEFFISEVSLHYGHKDGIKFYGIIDNADDGEFDLSDIGKTVFLTREEAEKALKET